MSVLWVINEFIRGERFGALKFEFFTQRLKIIKKYSKYEISFKLSKSQVNMCIIMSFCEYVIWGDDRSH